MLTYVSIALVALIGSAIGFWFGKQTYESRIGTIIGATLCSMAFVLLVAQLWFLNKTWLPAQIAVCSLCLVMTACGAADTSRRRGQEPSASVGQGVTFLVGVPAVLMVWSWLMSLL